VKFKFLGTEIYVSFLFCAVVCFMLTVDRTGLVLPTLFASLVHEGGHLLCMWATDSQPKAIRLIPTSVQIVRAFSLKHKTEAAILACGPAANLAFFVALFVNYRIFESNQSLVFAVLNLVLAVFNLLPVSGLDGGSLLTLALARFVDIYKAESIVKLITLAFAFVMFLLGVYLWVSKTVNISVFIVAAYLAVCGLAKR